MKILKMLFFLILTPYLFSELSIIKRFTIETSVDSNSRPRLFHVNPPIYIYEGFNKDLIVPHDTYFEVFDNNGNFKKRIGGFGKGPGDFTTIISIKTYHNQLLIQDHPNKISFFNKDYTFNKRIFFGGVDCSNFIDYFDVLRDKIYCSQKSYLDEKIRAIRVYNLNGKFIKSFFDYKLGTKFYPEFNLIHGKIVIQTNHIYYAFQSIPRLWQLDLDGDVIKFIDFGADNWKKIYYSKSDFAKEKKEKGKIALVNLILSGDYIYQLRKWKSNIVVHIIRDGLEENPINCFLVIDKQLKKASPIILRKGYSFSGAGKYIYLTKESRSNSKQKICEVLVCELKF